MIIIAERINATRRRVAKALEQRDADYIARQVRIQAEAGADFIDVNAASDPHSEVENLKWAVTLVQQTTDLPLCIDSSSPEGFRAALPLVDRRPVIINSVNGEKEKMEAILPLVAEYDTSVVALTMDESGLPTTTEQRLEIAESIINAAEAAGIQADRIYVDPCVQPLSTSPDQVTAVVEAVAEIMQRFPGVHTTCGLSNVSFGLPYRSILNRVFLAYLIRAGLDSAIIDPTERDMVATILAAEALVGRDEFCMNYIRRPKGPQTGGADAAQRPFAAKGPALNSSRIFASSRALLQ